MSMIFSFFMIISMIFIMMMLFKRGTLYTGLFFILSGLSFAVLLLFIVFKYSEVIMQNPVLQISIFTVATIVLFVLIIIPFIILLMFLYSAIMLIKKEGFSFRNLLSLLMFCLLGLYIFIWPIIGNFDLSFILIRIYGYLGIIFFYLLLCISIYAFSSVLSIVHILKPKLQYIIVLGAGLLQDKVTPLLASRIDKGIELLKKNTNAKLILSGGQGEDELISEAQAMYNYAISKGIDKQRIILEDKSTNTFENLTFSYQFINDKKAKVAIVTNSYHVFRSLAIVNKLKLNWLGYGAKTKLYFTINAFLREFIGYLYFRRKFHTIILTLITLSFLIMVILDFLFTVIW